MSAQALFGQAPGERAAQPRLDLHEGIDDPLAAGGCKRWPEHMRLLSSQGELVRGRCRATNLCTYCQTLYVVETVEMLTLDAMEHAPTLWGVLTAREHLTRDACRRHLLQLRRSLRKRWPDVEWFVQVEFQRRGALHLNLLFKGVPVDELDELRARTVELWCKRVDARPVGQWFGAIEDGVGVVRYLSKMLAHGLKAEQRPPLGWRGHRTSQTKGYLVRPAAAMREEARAALRHKRAVHRAIRAGHQAHDAELIAHQLLGVAAATTWRLMDITHTFRTPARDAAGQGGPESLPEAGSPSTDRPPAARPPVAGRNGGGPAGLPRRSPGVPRGVSARPPVAGRGRTPAQPRSQP